jgi:group II intron reverse transcriptase/maturase
MQKAATYLELVRERGKKGLPLERVYRQLFNRDLFLMAYGKIQRNKGAMTHGVTDETPDGMSLKKIDTIIELLRYERYEWLPARRVYIPKKNGKKRPLGLPTWSDKLVQEVVRLILEAYYEPKFSKHSHGFRPERSCATALREIYYHWEGIAWFIEGDIKACFDKIDHGMLLKIVSEHVHDGRFTNLMRELLEAGYMEDWTWNETTMGTPQGGVVSPILANILLDKLDRFVENDLIPKYTKGDKKARNPEYVKLINLAYRLRGRGETQKAEEVRKQAQKLPSVVTDDPNFRRLKYIRYADDFLLGFIGPRSEAEEIKREIGELLQEELKLELSEAKTLITNAREEAARFLGYEISTLNEDRKRVKTIDGTVRRSINGKVGLRLPKDVIEEKIKDYTQSGKATHRTELLQEDDYTIINTYQLEFRGMANYYQLAYNMTELNNLKGVMEVSLTKTLASKHQMSVRKVYEKYRTEVEVNGKKYKVLQVTVPKHDESKKPLVATWGGIPLSWDIKATIAERPLKVRWKGQTELIRRLLVGYCELCGRREELEVHHVRAMKDLHEYPERKKPPWVRRMIALQRKTMVLCETCHDDTQYGRPQTRPIIELAEIKAKQKEAMTRY